MKKNEKPYSIKYGPRSENRKKTFGRSGYEIACR